MLLHVDSIFSARKCKKVHIYVMFDFLQVEMEAKCDSSHEETEQQHEVE